MTLYAFNLLCENDQWIIIRDRGVQVAELKKEMAWFILYQVDGFHAEVKYHLADKKIVGMCSFSSTDALAPYLEKINIPGIV